MHNIAYMLDIETMHTNKSPVIVQIGIMSFDFFLGDQLQSLLIDVCPDSCNMAGGEFGKETEKWWKDRGGFKPAGDPIPIQEALVKLNNFISEGCRVWAKGPTFDLAAIEGYCDRLGIQWPWKYNMPRDTRTIISLAKELGWKKSEKREIPHQALEDCKLQIAELMSALNFIRKGRLK